MNVKTSAQLKRAIKPEMVEAANRVLALTAIRETIRPIVEGYQRDVLNRHQWRTRREFVGEFGLVDEVILNPGGAHNLEDEDFKTYLSECNEARKAAGLEVESDDYCPLLVADHEVVKAEQRLIDLFEPITGIGSERLWNRENRRKYLDLTLGLMIAHQR